MRLLLTVDPPMAQRLIQGLGIDTFDLEIVRNILNDLPLDQAFDIGKTRIFDGLQLACEIAKPWQPQSTALVLVTDGDTVPDSGMPALPSSISQSLVIGVGDARSGRFIDGHQSRQDASSLRQIAGRLRGVYHDANLTHLPSPYLAQLARIVPLANPDARGRRELALASVALGASLLATLPFALARFGVRIPSRPCPGTMKRDASRAATPAHPQSLPTYR